MRHSWLSYLLWVAAFLLFDPAASFTLPEIFRGRVTKSEPFVTYRGDGRSPEQIRGSNPEPNGFLTREPPRHYDGAYSLTNHLSGWDDFKAAGVPENFDTRYVSSSKDLEVARRFALSKPKGYIYMIKTTPNAVDVVQSIRDSKISDAEKKGLLRYEPEQEFAFLEGVHWKQVKAWATADGKEWIKNPEYDANFDQFTHGGSQPLLVDKADVDIKENAEKFMSGEQNRKAKDVGTAPSFCGTGRVKRDCTPRFGAKDDPVYESKWGAVSDQKVEGNAVKPIPGDELQQMGDGIAETHFSRIGDKLGLKNLVDKVSMSELRTRFKGFQLQSAESKAGSALLTAGLVTYVKDVADAFSSRTSLWDRAAVLTSIIPFVGCEVQAIAAEQKEKLDPADVALCNLGDGLLTSGVGMLSSMAVQASRAVRDHFVKKGVPSEAEIQRQRDEKWQTYLGKEEGQLVASVAEAHFKAEMAGPLFEATQAWGKLKAGEQKATSAGQGSQADVRNSVQAALKDIQSKFAAEVQQRKDKLVGKLPAMVTESLNAHAAQFNKRFILAFHGVAKERAADKGKIDATVKQLRSNVPGIPGAERIKSLVQASVDKLLLPSLCSDKAEESIHDGCSDAPVTQSPEKPKPVEKSWWEKISFYPKTTMGRG